MDELVIHPLTLSQLAAYRQSPPQAALFVGPTGSGKLTLAKRMTEQVLGLEEDGFDTHQYSLHVYAPEEGKAIGIEAARELERFLSLKVPSDQAVNRAVIVQDAHLLTPEAQNALLKTLEEPPAGTIILLTTNHEQALLPTIRSRAQSLYIRRPKQAALQEYFQTLGFKAADIHQVYAMSGGLPGLMRALLDNEQHSLLAAAQQARELLSQPMFDSLVAIDALAKQRELTADTLDILQQMAHISLQSASGAAVERWKKVLKSSYEAAEALRANGQPKLVLTDMALRF